MLNLNLMHVYIGIIVFNYTSTCFLLASLFIIYILQFYHMTKAYWGMEGVALLIVQLSYSIAN